MATGSICFLVPVIFRLACLRDIFSHGCHGNGVYCKLDSRALVHMCSFVTSCLYSGCQVWLVLFASCVVESLIVEHVQC